MWIFDRKEFKLHVETKVFRFAFQSMDAYDVLITGRRLFLLSKRSLSFYNAMIIQTSAPTGARIVELAPGLCTVTILLSLK